MPATPSMATCPLPQVATPLRVLFVDDDAHILHGLERALRPQRETWEVRFADGAVSALAELEQDPVDIIVSDMRMPGMTGGELLGVVAQRWPSTMRVILSGHTDLTMMYGTIGSAHQFLMKPCPASVIETTLLRAWRLRRILTNRALPHLVGGMQALPSMSQAHAQLRDLLTAPNPDMTDVMTLVASDMGLSARVLQLLNSAFFGSPHVIANPARAVTLLGVDALRSLMASSNVFVPFNTRKRTWFDPEHSQQHSQGVARLAGRIAIQLGLSTEEIEAATTAGLLHDAGHLLLAAYRPTEHAVLARRLLHEGDILTERMVLGGSHGEIGAYLFGLWGLPPLVVEAVAYHHDPANGTTATPCPLTCVHAADALLNEIDGHPERNIPHHGYLANLGLADRLQTWRDLIV